MTTICVASFFFSFIERPFPLSSCVGLAELEPVAPAVLKFKFSLTITKVCSKINIFLNLDGVAVHKDIPTFLQNVYKCLMPDMASTI